MFPPDSVGVPERRTSSCLALGPVGALAWPMRKRVMFCGPALIYPERNNDLLGMALLAAIYIGHAMLGGRKSQEKYPAPKAKLFQEGEER